VGRKASPGLTKKGKIWHIRKVIGSRRVFQSTGTSDLAEAENYLAHLVEEERKARLYGVRPERTFAEAAIKYVGESDIATLRMYKMQLRMLFPFIGNLPLTQVHMGTLRPFIEERKKQGRKNRTINYALQVVRHILNLAAGEWIDGTGKTWLAHAPKIKLLSERDKR
jgi:hypothetical protein